MRTPVAQPGPSPKGVVVRHLDESIIASVFSRAEPKRAKQFRKFLHLGHCGLVVTNDNGWVAYGWIALKHAPPHIPWTFYQSPCAWIFWCRTREEFQRQGYYNLILHNLCSVAGQLGFDHVMIDALDDNLPAVLAAQKAGFESIGQLTILKLDTFRLPPVLLRWTINHQLSVLH